DLDSSRGSIPRLLAVLRSVRSAVQASGDLRPDGAPLAEPQPLVLVEEQVSQYARRRVRRRTRRHQTDLRLVTFEYATAAVDANSVDAGVGKRCGWREGMAAAGADDAGAELPGCAV